MTIVTDQPLHEPVELVKLKEALAKLTCKCGACEKQRIEKVSIADKRRHQAIQNNYPIDNFTQVNFLSGLQYEAPLKDGFCPSCAMALDLLRGRLNYVLKDEESETNNKMFTSDKTTSVTNCFENNLTTLMKNDCIPSNSVTEPGNCMESVNDFDLNDSFMSKKYSELENNDELRNDRYLTQSTELNMNLLKRSESTRYSTASYSNTEDSSYDLLSNHQRTASSKSNARVTFSDTLNTSIMLREPFLFGDCHCLEKFVYTIRPPLPPGLEF